MDAASQPVAPTAEAPRAQAAGRRRMRLLNPIPLVACGSILIAVGDAAYERIGTSANVELIEWTASYSGGGFAVGMTERQPGIVVLSALETEKISVDAVLRHSPLGGTATELTIATPSGRVQRRLRGPLLITIDADGKVAFTRVSWSRDDFNAIRRAVDCESGSAVRCGAPFLDFADLLAKWPRERVPSAATQFLDALSRSRF